ncbi:ribonuclease H-like domain-containing protein [Mycena vitilis]|nr:ribonuclease H-like domain-containing protein [Mycena vitilis]
MWKIRGEHELHIEILSSRSQIAFPDELRRILMSPDIVKVGVGASNDLFVVWDDLRTDMNNIVDAGMMARLYLADKYPKPGYGPLSLKTSAADILGFTVVKEQTESNWSSNDLTAGQKEYAAVDAIVSLALHDELEGALARKEAESQVDIPSAWYTFNGRYGEPSRVNLDGTKPRSRGRRATAHGGAGENSSGTRKYESRAKSEQLLLER